MRGDKASVWDTGKVKAGKVIGFALHRGQQPTSTGTSPNGNTECPGNTWLEVSYWLRNVVDMLGCCLTLQKLMGTQFLRSSKYSRAHSVNMTGWGCSNERGVGTACPPRPRAKQRKRQTDNQIRVCTGGTATSQQFHPSSMVGIVGGLDVLGHAVPGSTSKPFWLVQAYGDSRQKLPARGLPKLSRAELSHRG